MSNPLIVAETPARRLVGWLVGVGVGGGIFYRFDFNELEIYRFNFNSLEIYRFDFNELEIYRFNFNGLEMHIILRLRSNMDKRLT